VGRCQDGTTTKSVFAMTTCEALGAAVALAPFLAVQRLADTAEPMHSLATAQHMPLQRAVCQCGIEYVRLKLFELSSCSQKTLFRTTSAQAAL